MAFLPPTPSEVAELHGVAPLSSGGSGEFVQLALHQPTGLGLLDTSKQDTISSTFINRRIYSYIWCNPQNAALYCEFVCRLLFLNGSSSVLILPLQTAIEPAGDQGMASDVYPSIATIGKSTQNGSENMLGLTLHRKDTGEVDCYVSSIMAKVLATAIRLEITSKVNLNNFRAWVGCLSTI